MIEFGRDVNQIFHTFRHVDAYGLNRSDVERTIRLYLEDREASMVDGLHKGSVQVKGVNLEFRAYKFATGGIHVGRITIA